MINRVADNGGAEVSLMQSLGHIESLGVHNVLQPLYDTEDSRRRESLEDVGVVVLPATGAGLARRVQAVVTAIRSYGPDVVHSSLWEADLAARIAAAWCRVPSLVSFVNMQYSAEARLAAPSPRRLRIYQIADGLLARHLTSDYHALTHAVADAMSEALRVERRAIHVIPRGRRLEELGECSPERSVSVRRRLGLRDDAIMILNVGRQERQKGQVDLVEAFGLMAADYPSAQLVIAGRPGSASQSLRERIESSEFRERIHLLGNRLDVPDLMAAADLTVVSSLWEGFGGAVAEAMYIGSPIVAYDSPAVAEVLAGCGVLAQLGDVSDLADAMRRVLAEPQRAAELGRRGRQHAAQHYDVESVAAQMATLYRRCAARRKLPWLVRRVDTLARAVSRRSGRGGSFAVVAYLLGRLLRPLASLEHFEVLDVDTACVVGPDLVGAEVVRMAPGSSSLRDGVLTEGLPPTQMEGVPRGRALWFGLRDLDGRLLGRVCLELETESGMHRGFSPRLRDDEGVISGLWLQPGRRGGGLASAMVKYAVAYGRDEAGLKRVLALVNVQNAPSRRLFDSIGFSKVASAYVLRLPGPRRVPLFPMRDGRGARRGR